MSMTLSIELLGLYEYVDIIGMKTIITRIKAAFQLVKNYNLNTENVTGLKYAYAAKWQTECSARTGAWERRSRHKAMRGGAAKMYSVVTQKIQVLPKTSMRPEMNSLPRGYLSLQSNVYSNNAFIEIER